MRDRVNLIGFANEATAAALAKRIVRRAVWASKCSDAGPDPRLFPTRAAYAGCAYTLKAIGKHFGFHYAMVNRIARADTLKI
jgi:hypothetical protein